MAWNDLEIAEMVDLFAPYIHDQNAVNRFLAIKEIAGLHELFVDAYNGVLKVRPSDTTKDSEYQKIFTAEKPVDYRHDRLARCAALFVECQAEHARGQTPPDEETAKKWDWAYDQLFPEGTRIINASYRAEAGNTRRVEDLLKGDAGKGLVTLFKSAVVHAGEKKGDAKETLFDVVQRWIAAGTELGALEAKKAARLAELSSEPRPEQRVVQAARSEWIAMADMITKALAKSKAPLKDRNAISHPLLSAAEKAGARATAPAADQAPSPVVDDESDKKPA